MNVDPSDRIDDQQEFADALRQLKPVKPSLDSSAMFYQAGFNAGKSEVGGVRPTKVLAAGLVAALLAAPAGYMAGQTSAVGTGDSIELAADVDPSPLRPTAAAVAETDPSDRSPASEDVADTNGADTNIANSNNADTKLAQASRTDTGDAMSTYASSLLSFWDRKTWLPAPSGIETFGSYADPLAHSDTIRHRHPSPGITGRILSSSSSSSKTLAVLDVREMAKAFEVVQ